MKAQINLFNSELLPRQTQVPAKWLPWAMAFGVVCCGLLMLGVKAKTEDAQQEGFRSKKQVETLLARVNALQVEINQHQPDPLLQAEVRRLEQGLATRQLVFTLLDKERMLTTGDFSTRLYGLAHAKGDGLWLTRIDLSPEGIALEGQADIPQAVHHWMARIREQPTFSGTAFETFDILRADSVKKPGVEPTGTYSFVLKSHWQAPSKLRQPGAALP